MKVLQETEVLIVGGGVSGLALAARLGEAGRRVLVLDKAPLPRDKVCGEGLMPTAMAQLRAWGIAPSALPGVAFDGLEYRTRHREVRLPFLERDQGRGVRRTELIALLGGWAAQSPGVSMVADWVTGLVREGGSITGVRVASGVYRAKVVIAADGVNSTLMRKAGVPLRPRGDRMALRQHFAVHEDPPPGRVRIGLYPPYDLYLTPVGEGVLLATLMTDRQGYKRAATGFTEVLRESPYAALFEGASPLSELLGWHHPLYAARRYDGGGMLLVGDAGGGTDPCLGMGMSLAFASVALAETAVLGRLEDRSGNGRWAREYHRDRKKLFNHYNLFDKIFRLTISSGFGSEVLVGSMGIWPGVSEAILDIIARHQPWKTFPWKKLLEPLKIKPAN